MINKVSLSNTERNKIKLNSNKGINKKSDVTINKSVISEFSKTLNPDHEENTEEFEIQTSFISNDINEINNYSDVSESNISKVQQIDTNSNVNEKSNENENSLKRKLDDDDNININDDDDDIDDEEYNKVFNERKKVQISNDNKVSNTSPYLKLSPSNARKTINIFTFYDNNLLIGYHICDYMYLDIPPIKIGQQTFTQFQKAFVEKYQHIFKRMTGLEINRLLWKSDKPNIVIRYNNNGKMIYEVLENEMIPKRILEIQNNKYTLFKNEEITSLILMNCKPVWFQVPIRSDLVHSYILVFERRTIKELKFNFNLLKKDVFKFIGNFMSINEKTIDISKVNPAVKNQIIDYFVKVYLKAEFGFNSRSTININASDHILMENVQA